MVSTNSLLEWAESPNLSSPVFARLLGTRDTAMSRPRIERLLFSGDPDVRAQIALGLGDSPQPSAASLLARAYSFEANPAVRRAIVTGLANQHRHAGQRWLELAERLDPDPVVRSLAQRGLTGIIGFPTSVGHHILWVHISSASPNVAETRPIRVVLPDGSTVSGIAAPDGQALVPAVTPNLVSIRVDGVSGHEPRAVSPGATISNPR